MKYKFFTILVFFLLAATSVSAAPQFPDLFYGELDVNGEDASTGTKLITKINGKFTGNITTDRVGEYGYSDPDKEQLAVAAKDPRDEGDQIEFFVAEYDGNLVQANSKSPSSVNFNSNGGIRNVNLTFDNVDLIAPLSVSLGDETVDEGDSIDLTPTLSNEGQNPSYRWSIEDDPTGEASIQNDGQETSTFDAPEIDSSTALVEVSVTVTRQQGDSKTANADITVNNVSSSQSSQSGQQGSSGAGGGSGAAVANPQSEDEESDKDAQVTSEEENTEGSKIVKNVLTRNETVFNFSEDQKSIQTVKITQNGTLGNDAEVSVDELDSKPSEIPKAASRVYRYQSINLTSTKEVSSASITFRVKKSFLFNQDAKSDEIELMRYSDSQWQSLETEEIAEKEEYVFYESETPGFSYYAITLKEKTEQDLNSSILLALAFILIAALLLLSYVFRYKIREVIDRFRNREEEQESQKEFNFNDY